MAYAPITLPCVLFMFIKIKFIYCHSCVMFVIKYISIYNNYVHYDEIIIQWSINILIFGIFKKDIKLSRNSNNVSFDSYDKYH